MSSLSCRRFYRVNESQSQSQSLKLKESSSRAHGSLLSLRVKANIYKRTYKRIAIHSFPNLFGTISCNSGLNQSLVAIESYRPLKWKAWRVTARLPDGTERDLMLNETNGETVLDLVQSVIKEFELKRPVIKMADSGAQVDAHAKALLLEGEEIVIEEGFDVNTHLIQDSDKRLAITKEILRTEREYEQTIHSVRDLYEKPLRKLLFLCNDDRSMAFFDWVEPLGSISKLLQLKLENAVMHWDAHQTKLGAIFSKQLWHQYDEYLNNFENIYRLLKEKEVNEEELVVICRLRQGAAKHSLPDFLRLPLERLDHYDNYLSQLASKTGTDHVDYSDICRAAKRAKSMVKRNDMRQEENFSKSPALAEQVKKLKKGRKTAINWPFKKSLVKNEASIDSGIVLASPTKRHKLFGQRLSVLCVDDQLPVPIMNMLRQLFSKGPYTVGIFRKSANARVCREIKAQLEEDPDSALDEVSVIVVASIFKEFLRSLPDFLLQAQLYNKWLEVVNLENQFECREKMSSLVQTLPPEHLLLLRHFLCVLWHIASRASENKMCSMNLGVCIGPSLLSNNSTSYPQRCDEVSKQVPKLISYLIDHCPDLFGEKVLNLFGKQEEVREDSREEESDSLNSLQERGNSSGGNSSIDSLERDLIDDKLKPTSTYGNKLSLSNLSRDSGLTLSDTQLYNPEEENSEGYSDTSNGLPKSLNRLHPLLTKSVPHLDSVEFENDINVTFSYGRSVGVSIDGSCHDVVRKRKFQGLIDRDIVKNKATSSGNRTNRSANASAIERMRGNQMQHKPINYSKSYSYGIDSSPEGDEQLEMVSPRISNRYRYRRPPLSAVLDSKHGHQPELRRTASEESLVQTFEPFTSSLEPMSLPYHLLTALEEKTPFIPEHHHLSASTPKLLPSRDDGDQVDGPTDRSTTHCPKGTTITSIAVDNNLRRNTSQSSHSSGSKLRMGSVCSSSSETASQRSSGSKQSSTSRHSSSHSSLRSNPLSVSPPSYQETMSRKEILARMKSTSSGSRTISSTLSSDTIYEQSVRVYNADLKSGTNITLRAVPVRVKTDFTHKEKTSSNNQLNLINGSREVSASGTTSTPRRALHHIKSVDTSCLSLDSSSNLSASAAPVTVQQRCAKDFTEDWRKDINWSVAQLRTLFSGQRSGVHRAVGASKSIAVVVNKEPVTGIKSGRPMSCRSSPATSGKGQTPGREGCVTVIRVSQNLVHGKPALVSIHQRSDSISSSGEESYV